MPMPLPNLASPPTDNLYKFMAMGGVIIVLFCFCVPVLLIESMLPKLTEAEIETQSISLELKYLREDSQKLTEDSDELLRVVFKLKRDAEKTLKDAKALEKAAKPKGERLKDLIS